MKLHFFAAMCFARFESHFKVSDYEKVSVEFGHTVAEPINASCRSQVCLSSEDIVVFNPRQLLACFLLPSPCWEEENLEKNPNLPHGLR